MKVVNFPLNGHAQTNADVAKHLLQMANWVMEDEFGNVRNIVFIIETQEGNLYRRTCGQSCDLARAVGLLAIAAARGAVEREDGETGD